MANINSILSKLSESLNSKAQAMEEKFKRIDADNSGSLSLTEFKELIYMHFTKTEITQQEILTIMRYFDSDGSGNIAFNEFSTKIKQAGGNFEMKTSYNEHKYEEKVNDASAQDLEKENQLFALQFFKKVVKGKRSRMIQAFRMADDQLAATISTDAVVEIMSTQVNVKDVDARRVCTLVFGDAKKISYESYMKLLDSVDCS